MNILCRAAVLAGVGSLLMGTAFGTVANGQASSTLSTVTKGVLTVAADNDMPLTASRHQGS